MMSTIVRLFLLVFSLFVGCSSGLQKKGIQIGIDPTWYPNDFGWQTSYVNGFTEDLLFEIASTTGTDFVRLSENADNLLAALQAGKYDAVLTSLPPYNFHLAKYDFSHNFLDLGPVLIVPVNAHYTDLSQMNNELVGTLTNEPAVLILQGHPEIIMRNYPSIPELLNAVVAGEIEGALLGRIPATAFVRDLFSGQLKIAGPPLTPEGLHLITLKGRHPQLIRQFDKTLDTLKKKKLPSLLKKWQLD